MATSEAAPTIQQHRRRGRTNKRVEYYLEMYRAAHPNTPDEPHRIAPWIIKRGLYKKRPKSQEDLLRHELSRHLKNSYFVDPQGREVRANHPIFIEVQTPDGPKRRSRWLPLFDAPPKHMMISAQLRRRSALSDVLQLRLDLESYNENNTHGASVPLPDCDFNKDIEELKQSASYPSEPIEQVQDEEDEI